MKVAKHRLVFTLLLITIQCTVSGAWYESNILGQKVREIEESQKDDVTFTLLEKVEPSTITSHLYQKEELIASRKESSEGAKKEIIVTNYNNSNIESITTSRYEQDLLKEIVEVLGKEVTTTSFQYENGQLIEKKEMVNGNLKRLTTYWRNSDGSLALSREIQLDRDTLISFYSHDKESIIITQQEEAHIIKSKVHPNSIITQEYSVEGKTLQTQQADVDEKGNLTIVESVNDDVIKTLYSSDGYLQEKRIEKKSGEKQEFVYEYESDGTLIHSTEKLISSKIERIERYYVKGVLRSKTQFVDETPIKSTRYNVDGTSIVTLFEENRPYADVTYAPDGKRVLSIEYRKEE